MYKATIKQVSVFGRERTNFIIMLCSILFSIYFNKNHFTGDAGTFVSDCISTKYYYSVMII